MTGYDPAQKNCIEIVCCVTFNSSFDDVNPHGNHKLTASDDSKDGGKFTVMFY